MKRSLDELKPEDLENVSGGVKSIKKTKAGRLPIYAKGRYRCRICGTEYTYQTGDRPRCPKCLSTDGIYLG